MGDKSDQLSAKQSILLAFHGYLNQLVSRSSRKNQGEYRFRQNPAIKDVVEACGVPHTEVDIILANRRSVGFGYQVTESDIINIYPPGHQLDLEDPVHLSEGGLSEARFVLDVHLGKLCRKLRLLGFDCLYRNDYEDAEIVAIGISEQRTILTRDRGILKYSAVRSGLLIRHDKDLEQATQVLNRYLLWGKIQLYKRCVLCNGLLVDVEKRSVLEHLKPQTRKCCHEFRRCLTCRQIYWQGAHSSQMKKWLQELNQQRIK